MSGYAERQFSDCATLVRNTVSANECSGRPYIGLEHIEEGSLRLAGVGNGVDISSQKTEFRTGDILFGKLRPYFRKVVRPRFDGVCSTDIWVVRAVDGVDQGFLYYWMASREFVESATRGSKGTKMPRADWGFVARCRLPVPPLPTQRRIAAILGSLDDKIELNRRMSRTLEGMAQALFKSWFIDFDPVVAKAQGRLPRPTAEGKGEGLGGLPATIADLFPDRLVDSPLGPIPEGWEVKAIDQVTQVTKGRSYKSAELQPSDTALVTLKSFLRGGGYREDGLKPYVGKYKAEQAVRPGEIVVAMTDVTQNADVIGRPAIVMPDARHGVLVASLDTSIVRPTSATISTPFLYGLFSTEAFRAHTYAHSSGTTVLHLAKNAIPSFLFACPTEQIQTAYLSHVEPMMARQQTLHRQNHSLAKLRDTLLPKLLSGEIEAPAVEEVA